VTFSSGEPHLGLDFGTTNSGAAVYDGHQVRVLALDEASADPKVIRSLLYITREHQVFIGKAAIDTYYSENIARASRMVRRYIGEIEMTFAEVGTFVKDVYVLVDELVPGRLLRSLKSGLASSYQGTTILGRFYTLEELIALYLRQIRERAETAVGSPVHSVVLGRPVSFAGSTGAADDERAQQRLRQAAEMAGFARVDFELEPVAAALHYERSISRPQTIAVFDFGGGTLDITVMRVGEPGKLQVFATGGLGIAGDVFDQRIFEDMLLEHLGRGSTCGEDRVPFPNAYTDAAANWQSVLELSKPDALHFMGVAQLTSSHPARVRALQSLVVNNYAGQVFDEVEKAKIGLSDNYLAVIRFAGQDVSLWQPMTRSQFVTVIASETSRVEACLRETIARSGLKTREIDAVVRTGGSAQIPCMVDMLCRVFGSEKVVLSDAFRSVTSGLAIRAAML